MTELTFKNRIWLTLLMSATIPLIMGLSLEHYFPDWRWSHYPFHAMVESVGAMSALIIAVLIIIMVRNNHLAPHFIIVACALISMGLLDGFHAVLHASELFIWLHSIATLLGGVIFAAVWIPDSWLTRQRQWRLVISTTVVSLTIAIVSILYADGLPSMRSGVEFSLIARGINIVGGLCFIIGAIFFVYYYQRLRSTQQHYSGHQQENIVFANHCLLFGVAGLLFETSVLWDTGWWWWHILRFTAYFVVLIYFFILFGKSQTELTKKEARLENINLELEQRVQQRTRELEKATRAKSDFLSSMSHELRTPLNAIIGFSQLLEMELQDFNESQQDNIHEILDASNHLLNLINEILDLSKIEAGMVSINMNPVELSPVLKQCLAMIATRAAARHITLIDDLSDKDYIVNADSQRLKQVLLNILTNAVKYNRTQGQINIYAMTIDEHHLRIFIADTGPGLSRLQISQLFTPFERLNAPEHIEGTGIGLSISQNYMQLMHGAIGVDSVPGEGSTFYIELELYPLG